MQRILFLIACFFICVNCFAQQYPFVHYTPKDGLVNSRVRKAYQDSKGRMYFMTFGGLSIYDGARFKNYTIQNGLLSDLVNDVLEVGDDSLLVAINTNGLNVLVHGEMKAVNTDKNSCPVVNQFLKSNEGNIYASTDNGLYRFGSSGFEKLSVFFPQQKKPIDYLGAIAEYKDYIVFTTNEIKNNKGLFLYSKKSDKIADALLQLSVLGLKADHNGIIWVGTPEAMYNLDTAALAWGKLELKKPYTLFANKEILANGNMNFNGENEPLIASDAKGIIRYSKDGTALPIACSDLSPTSMRSFFIDREDVLWVCHDGNGVYKLSNTKLQSTDTFSRENRSGIRTIKAFSPAAIWIMMSNGEWVLHTPAKTKHFTISPSINATPVQFTKTYLYAVYSNQMYIAPLPKDNETKIRLTKILTIPDTSNFGGESVVDPSGNFITFESRNICVIQNEKLIFTYPFVDYDLIEGLYIDKNKLLWVVSRSNGLMIFSIHPGDPAHYLQKEFQFVKEFETASPRCMAVDKNEILWVGTRYNGLIGFEFKNDHLRKRYHFQTQNGLTDNFVTSLACDNNENVIIGMQTGIDRLIKTKDSSYRLDNITKSNNIFAYIRYVWTDINNTVFAITNAGAVFQVEPDLFRKGIADPQLLVEGIRVNGKPVSQTSSSLMLEYYQRNISFSVAAPSFIDEKQIQYSYLLSGSGNNQWSDTTSVADINLLNLTPGNYRLHVKAFFPSTSYSSKEIEFPFQIRPPWWRTWWFRIIAGSLIVVLLIIAVRFYYRRKLEQQKAVLEKKQAIEKERTRIATDMHDDLGAGLSRIKFLSETIGIKKQQQLPIEEDISKIREYSHEMIDKMGEIVWALNEKNDSLSDLLSYTRSYAAEYLSQNGIGCTVSLPEHLSSAFVSGEIRRNVFLAVKEILHNVVKHSQANHVNIEMNVKHSLRIQVQDDGIGFDRLHIRPFSNGLHNIEKRMKDIGGMVEIQSEHGTAVKLQIPLAL